MTAAHTLYREFGFVRAPELDHSPKRYVHLWSFRLVLKDQPENAPQLDADPSDFTQKHS